MEPRAGILCSLSIFLVAGMTDLLTDGIAQEEPITEQGYEREKLGVNRYTAPSIERIFQQPDNLRPLPFEQLQRELPKGSPASREQRGLIFGGLVADRFSASAIELDFSPQRAKVLAQQDLVDYFAGELKTLPPTVSRTPLFEKLRAGVNAIRVSLSKTIAAGLKPADVKAIRAQAPELNPAIRQGN